MGSVTHADYAGSISEILDIDNTHPVFFDHALDHVPGMLLIAGMLDRIRGAAQFEVTAADPAASGPRIRATFSFDRFAELDAALSIQVAPGSAPYPTTSWTARTWQSDVIVASAEVEYPVPAGVTERAGPVPAGPLRAPAARAIHPALVHQNRAENVLLGTPIWTATMTRMALLNPAPGHYFAQRSEPTRSIEEIAEGCRQAGVLLWQLEYGRGTGVQLLLDAVELELPLTLPRDCPAELRWRRVARRGIAAVFSVEVWMPARSPVPAGVVRIYSRAVTEQGYRRLRSAVRSAPCG